MPELKVTVDLYSGRPNPWWTLTKPQAAEIETELSGIPEPETAEPPRLGFRGLVLETGEDPLARRRIVSPGRPPQAAELRLARRLLEMAGDRLPDGVRRRVLRELEAMETGLSDEVP